MTSLNAAATASPDLFLAHLHLTPFSSQQKSNFLMSASLHLNTAKISGQKSANPILKESFALFPLLLPSVSVLPYHMLLWSFPNSQKQLAERGAAAKGSRAVPLHPIPYHRLYSDVPSVLIGAGV